MEIMEHSLVTTGDNKMLCQYCKQKCFKLHRERKRRWWWDCAKCSVKYLVSLQGKIETLYFYTKDPTDMYTIQLDLKQKSTFIIHHTKNDVKPVKAFDKLIDVTPDSFQNKLQTYLVFL